MMNDERIIARIARNAEDELVIRTATYWNIEVVDMRWYKRGNPTRKGLRVNMDEAATLMKAIKKAIGNKNENEQESNED